MFVAEILNGPREGWLLPFKSELVVAPLQALMNPPLGTLLILDSDPDIVQRVSFQQQDGAWHITNEQVLVCDGEVLEPGTSLQVASYFQLGQTYFSLHALTAESASDLAIDIELQAKPLPTLPAFLVQLDAQACRYTPQNRYRGVLHWLASLIEQQQGSAGGHAVYLLQEAASFQVNRTWSGWCLTPLMHRLLHRLLSEHPHDLPDALWAEILLAKLIQAANNNPSSALALDMIQTLHEALLGLISEIKDKITNKETNDEHKG